TPRRMDVTFLSGREVERLEVQTLLQQKEERGHVSDRVEEKCGKDCVLHCGDWSRKDQMNDCAPSLGSGNEETVAKEV
nr:hypothetical protein [Actinomycetes bacterium]